MELKSSQKIKPDNDAHCKYKCVKMNTGVGVCFFLALEFGPQKLC